MYIRPLASPIARVCDNPILTADSYKASHFRAYPDGTRRIVSYIESRGGRWDRTLVFGLQMFLKTYLATRITAEMVDEAEELITAHGLPFNRAGWDAIRTRHGGYLPVSIRAVPEGTVLPTRHVMLSVENTDDELPWLTSYVETALLRAVWYPTTVATQSWHLKAAIRTALEETSDDPDGQLPFKLHDFGARGVSSGESAGIGGLAHLVNFRGSDTMEALVAARRFYGERMAGLSIPAAEHSTVTAWGRDGETAAYQRMLDAFARPGALLAVVSDSYDLSHAVRGIWGGTLMERVKECGATVVVRPDSGDATTVPVDTVEALADRFGATVNGRGYRVLHPAVRVIQGDGINEDSIRTILANLKTRGFAADNIAFGMGGALLQGVNRDTQRFAMKASAALVGDTWRDVFKDPATDPGKRSKAGRLALIRENGRYETVRAEGQAWRDLLVEVYRNGEIRREATLAEIRARSEEPPLD
ncbi:nicotinate phosphoribosyltransferase [Muricoccus radiodurans]|uniref:nicotinate phosphoribosyltransferase n=1 Tax=Muricoccus radiodurans TaxID=2231721 RepID=UPI003CFA95B7